MAKWVITVLILIIIVGGGWLLAQQWTFRPIWAMPKFGEVTRGDIAVPISAAGLIHADQVVDMKSEASGSIIDVPVVEGDYVQKSEPLVVLDPDDEQRLRDRAQADYDQAQAVLTQARVAVSRAKANIDNAKARLDEISAQVDIAAFQLQKMEETLDEDSASPVYNPQEIHDIRARHRMAVAQRRAAEIAIRSAELAEDDAIAAVKSREATVESARKTLEDAEERLRETTVLAPQDGIVTEVYVKPGMLVQSATQGFTGGTPLLVLADIRRKKVIARVNEADYGRVMNISPIAALPDAPGLRETVAADQELLEKRTGTVEITVDAFPDDRFEGRIIRVEPQGKLNAGSSLIQFDVHVEITDDRKQLLPLGAQAQVEFTVESVEGVLRVPAEAVKSREEQRGIYVKVPPEPGEEFGRKFVPCRFGISDGEHVEVQEVLSDDKIDAGVEVYTKLPQDPSEE